jgi:hypothetical protein
VEFVEYHTSKSGYPSKIIKEKAGTVLYLPIGERKAIVAPNEDSVRSPPIADLTGDSSRSQLCRR